MNQSEQTCVRELPAAPPDVGAPVPPADAREGGTPVLSAQVLPEASARALARKLQFRQCELERQNAELRLAHGGVLRAAEEHSQLFEFAPIGYFVLDTAGLVHKVNRAGAALLARERHEICAHPFELYVAPEAQEAFASLCRTVWANQVSSPCELQLMRPDSSACHVLIESAVASDVPVSDRRCLLAVWDITERKAVEDAMRRQVEELRAKSDELVRFNRALVDRELRMIELKREVNELCALLGQPRRYPLAFDKEPARL